MSSRIQRGYAPMDRSRILGFPNPMPSSDWLTYLPFFKDQKGDDVVVHLLRFHMHIRKLKIKFHEDCRMKFFMETLEEKVRSWYENLPTPNICSLKNFHTIFCEKYKGGYPSLLLIQNWFDYFESFIQYLEDYYDDDQFTNDEILEALNGHIFQHYEQKVEVLLELSSPKEETEDVCCLYVHEYSPRKIILAAP